MNVRLVGPSSRVFAEQRGILDTHSPRLSLHIARAGRGGWS
jgi:hypothetical protein